MVFKIELDQWYTADEVAELLSVSKKLLDLQRATGVGPEYSKIGRKVYYSGEELMRWIKSGSRKSTSDIKPGNPDRPI